MSWRQHQGSNESQRGRDDSWHRQERGRSPMGNWKSGGGGSWRRQERGRSPEPDVNCGPYFTVLHPSKYQGEAPTLDPPKVLGFFSVDSEKKIHYDDSMMPVLSSKYTPEGNCMKVDLDLNRGQDMVGDYTCTSTEYYHLLLQWILKNQRKLRADDSSDRLVVDIVCTRLLLVDIMQLPYAQQVGSDWEIYAKYFKGSIYLRYVTYADDNTVVLEEHVLRRLHVYGHKFQQYMTGGDPDDVLEPNCQFRCGLQLHLNELSILFAPKTDAVDMTCHKANFKDMSSFVRLKAAKELSIPVKLCHNKKFTLNRWWIENILTGVPRLLVGRRNHEGVVHTLEMLQISDLPSKAEGEWEPSVCINFLVKFLNFITEKVVADPDQVHKFEWFSLPVHFIRHSHHPNIKNFLPTWYTQQLFATKMKEESA